MTPSELCLHLPQARQCLASSPSPLCTGACTHPPVPQVTSGQGRIYAYEVDGLGGTLHSFDDPNIPSLLSMPLLGYDEYDKALYDNTRKVILSPANKCVRSCVPRGTRPALGPQQHAALGLGPLAHTQTQTRRHPRGSVPTAVRPAPGSPSSRASAAGMRPNDPSN